tara:strand:+ start:1047 stop:1715 length:669 start_codon:yes stop_codon:yes gene_type:complete
MESKFNWVNYNLKRNKEAIKINNFNIKSKINYLEKGVYKNVRDIYALALLLSGSHKKRVDVLDYGGNLMSHVNLINKINTKKIYFTIFNPFSPKEIKNKINLKIKSTQNLKILPKKKFDLIYFGSVLQYIENLKLINKKVISNSKFVLITHTPITFDKKSYIAKQSNEKKLFQKIHTLEHIKSILLKKNFQLVFKSINDFKFAGLKIKKNGTHSLNLLFSKN